MNEIEVRARATALIMSGRAEEVLELLARFYGIEAPRITVGLPKGYSGVLACYVRKKNTIYVKSRREYMDPFVVLHEFYHHLRFFGNKHRGTERGADRYAAESIKAYLRLLRSKHSSH